MKKIKQLLSAKLSLSIIALAAPIFILALGILFLQSRYFYRQEAAHRADNALNTVMQQVRNYMAIVETATNSNVYLVEQYFQPDSLLSLSRRIVQLNRHVNGCSITAEPDMFPQYGRYFSAYTIREGDSVITAREAEYDYYEMAWYKTPRELRKACWIDPYDDYNEGTLYTTEMIASYCKPFYMDGKMAGVISSDLSFRRLSETISAAECPYPDAYYVLIGSDGRYLIHPDTTRLFKSTVFADYNPNKHADMIALGHEMVAGKQGRVHVGINNRQYHVSYRPVTRTNWSLALVIPDDEILKDYYRLTYIVSFIIIIGLLVIYWLCHRLVNISVRPISYLAHKSQRISEGYVDEIIPHTEREDAIGRLQNSFAVMQQSLNDRLVSIHQATEETRQRNDELALAREKAEEAVQQKELFIQNVSHQIRTPLNIILGFIEVLKTTSLAPEELTDVYKTMKYNAMHLNRMVLMLFDSSDTGASEELHTQKTDLLFCNELAQECIGYTQARFPGLTIRFETCLDDDIAIMTNRLYLTRTILELLYNAAKYSDGQHIALRIEQTPATIRFIIEDVGTGLPDGSQSLIFEPFAKVDNLSEGLGLGLPLAKRHAQNLGGDLTLDATYHEGCRFVVEMPK